MAFIAITTIWGCKKDVDDTPLSPTQPTNQLTSQQFFADNRADATQSFSINAATGGQVTGVKGTQLIFEPNAFIHFDGSPVIGTVDIKLVEVLSMADMIMLNVQTVADDNGTLRPLRSGGALGILAKQNGTRVKIVTGGLITKLPTDVGDPNMDLFSGRQNPAGDMIWTLRDSGVVDVEDDYYVDTTYVVVWPDPPIWINVNLDPDSLQWENCDYFWYSASTTSITATAPSDTSLYNWTQMWIAFPSGNAIFGMNQIGQNTFTPSVVVGVGLQAVLVGFKQDGVGGLFSSFTPITITPGMNVPITFTPTTLAQFQADLNGL